MDGVSALDEFYVKMMNQTLICSRIDSSDDGTFAVLPLKTEDKTPDVKPKPLLIGLAYGIPKA